MTELVYQKFETNKELQRLLLNTGTAELIEGNTWGDVFWGKCNGQGLNNLGIILMATRTSLRESTNEYWTN